MGLLLPAGKMLKTQSSEIFQETVPGKSRRKTCAKICTGERRSAETGHRGI
jgi:hypothetical protein